MATDWKHVVMTLGQLSLLIFACALALHFHETTLAATFGGIAGGIALPGMARAGIISSPPPASMWLLAALGVAGGASVFLVG